MKSILFVKFFCAFLVFVSLSNSVSALRNRGDEYVGLQFKDKPRPKKGNSRILGGEIAAEGSVPWQVSLQNHFGNHFCGGAIFDDEWIITAASCVAGLNKRNFIVVMSTNDWMGESWWYAVEDVAIHCNFDKPLYHNDIALIKLQTKIKFDEKTKKIAIAEEDLVEDGDALEMTGWGSWETGGDYPSQLKKLNLTYVPYEECKKAYGGSDEIDVGHLCTHAGDGKGACHGDTGGPLVDANGKLVGLSSFGVPCGKGFPDVFTRVAFYNDWIRTTLKGCSIAP